MQNFAFRSREFEILDLLINYGLALYQNMPDKFFVSYLHS